MATKPIDLNLLSHQVKEWLRSRNERHVKGFQMLDKDRSNAIDLHELSQLVKDAGWKLSEEQVKQLFEEFDLNNDGIIEYHEYVQTLSQ